MKITWHRHEFITKLTRNLGANFILIAALFLLPTTTLAVTQQDLNNKNTQLKKARDALNATQANRKTLQGEIANYDSQIGYIQAQLGVTSLNIQKLEGDIATLTDEITKQEKELEKFKEQLSEIVRVSYEDGQLSNIEIIIKSSNFSEFVNRSEYIEAMQLKVKDTATKVTTLLQGLNSRKAEVEQQKKKAEDLKNQQLAQNQQINSQRSAKDLLLQRTKGDEAAYQTLVKKIQAEYARLQSQMWTQNGNYISLGHVYPGSIIGYIGNSGFSTGCHLHFEIRNSSQGSVNPASFFGGGYFQHPVPGVWVSAGYGYSSSYFPGVFHTGIDYADGCAGTPVRATAEGDIIARVSGRPNTYDWSYEYGNYVKIKHTNGMFSLYAHLR